MRLYREFYRWVRYLRLQLAAAEVDERSHAKAVARIEARKGYDFRKVDAKQRAHEDTDYIAAMETQDDSHDYRKLVEAILGVTDSGYSHVSREITRRSNSASKDRRNGRFGE